MESVFEPPMGVRVWLSSGDSFYVDAGLEDVQAELNVALSMRALVQVGSRVVNPHQVCQLTLEAVPSLETPEPLEQVVA